MSGLARMAGSGHGGIRKGSGATLLAESRHSIALILALHARVAVGMRARAKAAKADGVGVDLELVGDGFKRRHGVGVCEGRHGCLRVFTRVQVEVQVDN